MERKQSKWRVTLHTITCCSAADCGEQSLRTGPCRSSRQGFWEGVEHEDMQRIHHLSPSRARIIHLLGDSSDFCEKNRAHKAFSCSSWQVQEAFQYSMVWDLALWQGEVGTVSATSNALERRCLWEGQRGTNPCCCAGLLPTTSRSWSHIFYKSGLNMFPPPSRRPPVWWWILRKHQSQW